MKQSIFENAEWIFADCKGADICNRYFEYQTEFEANPAIPTMLYISAHSQYVVYINGCFVGCGQYDDYEDYQVYDTIDITAYIKKQNNNLYIGHYVCGSDFSTRQKQKPGIIFAVWNEDQNLLSSNCKCFSRENRHFEKTEVRITRQLGYTFEYDATAAEEDFSYSVLAGKEKKLFARPVKKLEVDPFRAAELKAQGIFLENDASLSKAMRMQTAYLSACRREDYFEGKGAAVSWMVPGETRADGIYLVLDLGKESAGLLEFFLEVSEETEVLIGFGEHLDDLRVRSAVGGRNFCFRYFAKKGQNEFFYPFQRIGLRYLQFHIYTRTGTISAGIREQCYPVTRYPLQLTDKLHQRIYEVGCNTLELCMHEHYEDCPWREQALYAMDSRVQILCGYYAFHEYEFPKANLLLMLRTMRPDGLLELCPPGKVWTDIPSFSAVFVREVLEYVEYSKDIDFVEQIFPELNKLVDGFAQRMQKNHLVPLYDGSEYWNFYEWREGIDGSGKFEPGTVDCLLNAFMSDAFRCFAQICEMAGQPELAERYFGLHRNLNQAMHQMFFDEKLGAYRSNLTDKEPKHALTQGMMLYVGAVPDEWMEKVAHAIIDGELVPCSLSMSIYVYEALLKCSEKYQGYVLDEIERIWGKMLSAGADTFWETDLGADDFKKAGSLCHGWSAVPVYLFGKYFQH
ncbi:MAG: hypothetical protein J6C37_09450 [Roseburia sp.]|nr:hypothetical protein [Roseburia sp.]